MKFGVLVALIALGLLVANIVKNGVPWDKKKPDKKPSIVQTVEKDIKEIVTHEEIPISGYVISAGKVSVLIPGHYEPLKEGDFYKGRRITKLNQGGAVFGEGPTAQIVLFVLTLPPQPDVEKASSLDQLISQK